MRIFHTARLAGIALALSLAAVGGATAAGSAGLKVRDAAGFGPVIVDQAGRSLYVFTLNDAGATIGACEEECLKKWPPLLSDGKPEIGDGVEADRVATVKRPSGERQVTYDGWPLFYFHDDRGKEIHGQGMRDSGGPWRMIAPDGEVVTKSIPATPPEQEDESDPDFP